MCLLATNKLDGKVTIDSFLTIRTRQIAYVMQVFCRVLVILWYFLKKYVVFSYFTNYNMT